ncbi:MAG: hypothetical protein QM756_00875 [Polyangiaceae bacterium]
MKKLCRGAKGSRVATCCRACPLAAHKKMRLDFLMERGPESAVRPRKDGV